MNKVYVESKSKLGILIRRLYRMEGRLYYARQESVWYRMYAMAKHQDYLDRLEVLARKAFNNVSDEICRLYKPPFHWQIHRPVAPSHWRKWRQPEKIISLLEILYPEGSKEN